MNFPLHLQRFVISKQGIDLFVPDVSSVKEAYEGGAISFPYWSKVWPASIALSEFILQQPQRIQNKKLLELGAGLGLPSLVAARYAKHVFCTDSSAAAIAIVDQSAIHHRLENLTTAVLHWKDLKNHDADVLLLSDVNYEPESFSMLLKIIKAFLQNGAFVLLSTPQRLMAKAFVEPLLSACIYSEEHNVKWGEEEALVTVMMLQKEKA